MWGWENPPGSGDKDRSALASPSIILTLRKSETLSPELHFPSSCGILRNTVQKELTGVCTAACAGRNQPSLKLPFLPTRLLCSPSLAVSSRCNDKRVHRMAAVMVMWWALAITSWISDRWLCWLWQAINFPYFHSFW